MSVSSIGPSNATAQMLAATQSEARPHLGLFHFKDGPKHSQLGSRAGYIDAKLCSPDCHDPRPPASPTITYRDHGDNRAQTRCQFEPIDVRGIAFRSIVLSRPDAETDWRLICINPLEEELRILFFTYVTGDRL